jgi:hypothetical protein
MRKYLNQIEAITAEEVEACMPTATADGFHAAFAREHTPRTETFCLTDIAEAEVTENIENGLRLHTTKITARCSVRHTLTTAVALRLTDTEGTQWLVGGVGTNKPLITTEQMHPGEYESPTVVQVNVIWTGIFPLLELI